MILPMMQLGMWPSAAGRCRLRADGSTRVSCLRPARATVASTPRELLESFWEARGVLDPLHRKRLVDAAVEQLQADPLETTPLAPDVPLPGLSSTWTLEQSTLEVVAASRRLLALQQMLGGGMEQRGGLGGGGSGGAAVDVVWMVVREPRLLSVDLGQLTGRLLDMKLATFGSGVDVLRVVEAQPALLISDSWKVDLASLQQQQEQQHESGNVAEAQRPGQPGQPGRGSVGASSRGGSPAVHDDALEWLVYDSFSPAQSSSVSTAAGRYAARGAGGAAGAAAPAWSPGAAGRQQHIGAVGDGGGNGVGTSGAAPDPVQQLITAWQHGISSDGDREWASRLSQLAAYATLHGDCCVGFRDGDDPDLSRWANKQRADFRSGQLQQERLAALQSLGFLFDGDEAEWVRWYRCLLAFKATTGHASPMPLVTGADMYLINWCAIQRIARRSRVLAESRIARLDELGFDWSGADPLS